MGKPKVKLHFNYAMYYTCIFHIPEVKIICFVSLGFDFLDFLKQSTFLTINSNKNSSNNL